MGRHSTVPPRRRGVDGVAAIIAQGSQAGGSLLLQVVAARSLGIAGLGEFGLLYGLLVLATAITSGFVGDSLTVLDRQSPAIRAALQNWLVLLATAGALLCAAAAWATGFAPARTAAAFGLATFVFVAEDAVRRLLMANLRFWRVVVVDLVSVLVVLLMLAAAPTITLAWLFVALAAGQGCAAVVGVGILPSSERWLANRVRGADQRTVFDYGAIRALQQAVRPSLLAITRIVVIAIVGLAAAGQLEAARIYTAPALLVVFGLNSFLFASYATDRDRSLRAALRSADRAVLMLVGITSAFGVLAVLFMPVVAPLIAGRQYPIPVLTVIGWMAYTVSVAAVTPYGALAAVRGRQAAVLGVRVADSILSLAVAALLIFGTGSAEWVPFGLAIGSLIGGLVIRRYVLAARSSSTPTCPPSAAAVRRPR